VSLASVQTASDAAPMTWGLFLTMLGAMALLALVLTTGTAGFAWLIARLEDRTRYDEDEDAYPTTDPQIPARAARR
jgi:cation transporter-like permease